MIVYNVGRQWFTEKAAAEDTRKYLGLPPGSTIKLIVNDRKDLAELLNLLCIPPVKGHVAFNGELITTTVETAFVDPTHNVPDFVPLFLVDPAQRAAVKADREARGVGIE